MPRLTYLSFADGAVELSYPDEFASLIPPLLGGNPAPQGKAETSLKLGISRLGVDHFSLSVNGQVSRSGGLGQMAYEALVEAERALTAEMGPDTLLLHAASLVREGKALLIAGESRSGKSTLTAWLAAFGFQCLSDEISTLSEGGVVGLRRPLTFRDDVWSIVSQFTWFSQAVSLADGRRLAQAPVGSGTAGPVPCGLILIPQFIRGAEPKLERIDPARAAALVMARNHSWSNSPDHGFGAVLALVDNTPAVGLVYGDVTQLEALATFAIEVLRGGRPVMETALAKANAGLALQTSSAPAASIPAATPKKGPVRLTIGMATYDDYDGVYFTVQALRLYHPEVLADTEILVIDNNPRGTTAPYLKDLDKLVPNYRYVPLMERVGAAGTKQRIFAEAEGRYVLSLDCHVLLPPNTISRLLAYFDQHPMTSDLLQGPLMYDELTRIASHWEPVWSGGMLGKWTTDPRAEDVDGEPFDIPLTGTGLFACRKDAWVGFNPAFRGFGAEEGYIHEKFRQAGHRTLCLPFLRWVHRFVRPNGPPYVNKWEDRMFNYFVGFTELGLPTAEMEAHFAQVMGAEVARRIFADIRKELGIVDEQVLEAATG